MKALAVTMGLLISAIGSSAQALCIYNGEFNARTTVAQEFRDSQWVVKAKVLEAADHFSDQGESWTVYSLAVQRAYKGHPPRNLRFFTLRNSGGFYMDRAWAHLPEGHDIGGEYLLFLNPRDPSPGQPRAADGTVFVNYSCGVSGPWKEVSATSRAELLALERSQRRRK